MARYEHLPIFKVSFDLAVHIEKIVKNFSRYHKYTLGTELRNQSRAIVEAIIEANSKKDDRREYLLALREKCEQLKVLARLCHESGGFQSTKAYLYTSEQIVNIAKQNEGWLRMRNTKINKQQNQSRV
jgi:four helix bundle protein